MKEMLKSEIMIAYVIIFLGLITIDSFIEKDTKKDLNHGNESSQIVITNK